MSTSLAIVTGTSSGIGAATARLLVDRGWSVVGVSRRQAPIDHPRYSHVTFDLAAVDALSTELAPALTPALTAYAWRRVALVNNAARADLLVPIERLDPVDVLDMFALNTVTPIWLMGFVGRAAPAGAALRIVNVSTGAATTAFPGLTAYGSSKAALRMAGQVLAAELDSGVGSSAAPRDTALLSYQPGTVDTPMQTSARSIGTDEFPWGQIFRDFHARGLLVSPTAPAAEIVAFLESDSQPRLTERRLGAS
jgi:NAD(P)-dependent dehydrogenase (short-subunit alcohol dehydrogenase family)